MIMDQDSAFMSTIMNYSFKRLNIKVKTVAPFNHQSLQSRTWNKITALNTNLNI